MVGFITSAVASERLEAIRQEIPPAVELLVVSKKQSPATLIPFIEAGQRLFGENRVQEALEKWPALRKRFPDCELHLIGRLQTNKVVQSLNVFDAIHSLDRVKLIEALVKHRRFFRPNFYLLIQVNFAGETQKGGVAPENLTSFIDLCNTQQLPIQGLMTLPPQDEDPKPYFEQLKALADKHNLPRISMGMSADYRQAITCGSTIVRLGTALFTDSL
ncbi:MAG: YggS family pyridoxal phosphate-dependent enzyme [Alphaproteobacteria bacterium]